MGALSGCGGSGDNALIAQLLPGPVLTGQFGESAVGNVAYSTSSGLSGTTDVQGKYSYRAGDTVKFSIGKIVLGQGPAGSLVTPIGLVNGATDFDNTDVVKILQLLQTLDDDLNPANGINIASSVVTRLTALSAEKNVRDITDLTADVITPAFAGFASGAPVLKTAQAAKLQFAEALGFVEVSGQHQAPVAIGQYPGHGQTNQGAGLWFVKLPEPGAQHRAQRCGNRFWYH